MVDSDIERVRSLVQAKLDEAGEAGVRGTDLARRVRDEVGQQFDPRQVGYRSFRHMFEQLVPTAVVIGRAGADVVYGTSSASSPPVPGANDPWLAWATPTDDRRISVSPDGAVAVEKGPLAGPGLQLVEKPTVTDHRRIAEEFLEKASIEAELRAKLRAALNEESWWPRWVTTMRSDPKTNHAWLVARLRALTALLERQLERIGIAPGAREKAKEAILGGRNRRQRRRPLAPSTQREKSAHLRTLALKIVGQMSESELGQLWLPLGAMCSALSEESGE